MIELLIDLLIELLIVQFRGNFCTATSTSETKRPSWVNLDLTSPYIKNTWDNDTWQGASQQLNFNQSFRPY